MNTNYGSPLLQTIHGSGLYGLSHEGSDRDLYSIFDNDALRKPKQTFEGNDDITCLPLSSFLKQCDNGAPMALEAMFSSFNTGPLTNFAKAYRLNTHNFHYAYLKAISSFAEQGLRNENARLRFLSLRKEHKSRGTQTKFTGDPTKAEKYRRHALRLALNLSEGLEYARFNPTMNAKQKDFLFSAARLNDMDYAELLLSLLSH